jgi:hypothetical protein
MSERCDTDAVVVRMESISVLKSLRQKVEEGRTSLPVSAEQITAEIEVQRHGLEEEIAKCGSLAGVPEDALTEAGISTETTEEVEDIQPEIDEFPEGGEIWPE